MRRSLLCWVIVFSAGPLFSLSVFAQKFEFLTYSPPSAWSIQQTPAGITYRRPSGIGLISIFASQPASGSPSDEFEKTWKARVEPSVPGPAPRPQLEKEGDYSIAVGARPVDAQGTLTVITVVAIVGEGRTMGLFTLSAGDDALREVTAFLASIKITPTRIGAVSSGKSGAPDGIEARFDVPPGYLSAPDGRHIVIRPQHISDATACVYGFGPARSSAG